ncbi:MAG TPA: CHAT domain-containing protein [Pyrinomonadaceae bacterium]|nr:CHAT domain-containing protein [Pyrinomonadaceae bacterium]
MKRGALEIVAATNDDSPALRLPWELIDVEADHLSPLHTYGISVTRRPSTSSGNRESARIADPLRILVVVSRPKSLAFLDPRLTAQAILQASEPRSDVQVDFVWPPTFSALLNALEAARSRGIPFHILHFDGHGTTVSSEGHKGALCFEKEGAELDLIRADQFAVEVARRGVGLVVLEACNTADDISGQDSVALALIRQGVPAVVAMGYTAHFEMTHTLISFFYEQLLNGRTVEESLLHARQAIFERSERRITREFDSAATSICDWFVPQLYQMDGNLAFRPAAQHAYPKFDAHPVSDLYLPPPPRAGFQGRAYELHLLERTVREYPIITLHGMAGVGKSALAREAAEWWSRTRLFDNGVVWVSLEGNTTKESLLRAMQHPLQRVITDHHVSSEEDMVRLCSERRILIIWDGFTFLHEREGAASDPEREEIEGFATRLTNRGSRIILTTRDRRPMESIVLSIDRPTNDDAVRLLTSLLKLKATPVSADSSPSPSREFIRETVQQLDGHPHSCELLAAAIETSGRAIDPAQSPKLVARAVQEHPEPHNRSIHASLGPSLARLSPEAHAALPAIILMKGGGLESIAETTSDLSPDRWESIRTELEEVGLIRVDNFILRPHPLIGEVVTAKPSPQTVHHFLEGVGSLCYAYAEQAESEVDEGINLAMRYSDVVIRRAIDMALESGNIAGTLVIAYPLRLFLEREGKRDEAAQLILSLYEAVGQAGAAKAGVGNLFATEAANALKRTDPLAARKILIDLIKDLEGSEAQNAQSDLNSARSFLREIDRYVKESSGAQEDYDWSDTGDDLQVDELTNKAEELLNAGLLVEAEQAAAAVIEIEKRRGNYSSVARKLVMLGEILVSQERSEAAEQVIDDALYYASCSQDREATATARLILAKIDLARRRFEDAIAHAQKALKDFRDAGDKRGQLVMLNVLGDCERQRHEYARALVWYDKAVELAELRNDLSNIALSRGNRALVLADEAESNQYARERERLLAESLIESEAVLAIWERVGQTQNVGLAHSNIANALLRIGRLDEAEKHGRLALDIFEGLDHPHAITALLVLEQIAMAQGDLRKLARWQSRHAVAEAWKNGIELEPQIPLEAARMLLEMAMDVYRRRLPVQLAFSCVGVDLEQLFAVEPGFTRNLVALATEGASRPKARVSSAYKELVDEAWKSQN